jgi:hypothetical protein
MPRTINRVLANNEIIALNQAEKNKSVYRNKYADTIELIVYGFTRIHGKSICQCTARAKANGKEKVFKSLQAAKNFINQERERETIFGLV